jgi:hypothetical protein
MPTDIARYSIELFKPGGECQCRPTLQDTRSSFSSQAVKAPVSRRSSIVTLTSRSPNQHYDRHVDEQDCPTAPPLQR